MILVAFLQMPSQEWSYWNRNVYGTILECPGETLIEEILGSRQEVHSLYIIIPQKHVINHLFLLTTINVNLIFLNQSYNLTFFREDLRGKPP